MDIGDIISGVMVLLFVLGGPIMNALSKGSKQNPPPPRPQPRTPSSQTSSQASSQRTSTASTSQGSPASQGGWQERQGGVPAQRSNQPANSRGQSNDLQARLEEARRRVQAQQARNQQTRPLLKSQPASNKPVPVGRSGRGMAGSPTQATPATPRSTPRGLMTSSPTLEGASLESRTLEGRTLEGRSLESASLEGPLRSTVSKRPTGTAAQQTSLPQRHGRARKRTHPLLSLDPQSIQSAIIWKQILDKPRYKQRLQRMHK